MSWHPTRRVYKRSGKRTYPSLYLGMCKEQRWQEACLHQAGGASAQEQQQQQPRHVKGKERLVSAARLVNAVCNGMPQNLSIDNSNSGGGWAQVQVIHVCNQSQCVNPRHLIWGNNKLNASNNARNSYQVVLDTRGDVCVALEHFKEHWAFKMHTSEMPRLKPCMLLGWGHGHTCHCSSVSPRVMIGRPGCLRFTRESGSD